MCSFYSKLPTNPMNRHCFHAVTRKVCLKCDSLVEHQTESPRAGGSFIKIGLSACHTCKECRPIVPAPKKARRQFFCGLQVDSAFNNLCAVYAALSACCGRSDLNPARISDANSSGSSHAAKCPPLPTSLK